MHWFKKLRLVWLAFSIAALAVAQFAFNGEQTFEAAANLIGSLSFFMLVLCAPVSLLGYVGMLPIFNFFQPHGFDPYNSRLALLTVWAVYFVPGLLQWFALPLLWRRKPIFMGQKSVLKINAIIFISGIILMQAGFALIMILATPSQHAWSSVDILIAPFTFLVSGHAALYVYLVAMLFMIMLTLSFKFPKYRWISYISSCLSIILWAFGYAVNIIGGMIG